MIRVASYSLNLIELQFQTKCYNLYSPPDKCAQVIRLVFFHVLNLMRALHSLLCIIIQTSKRCWCVYPNLYAVNIVCNKFMCRRTQNKKTSKQFIVTLNWGLFQCWLVQDELKNHRAYANTYWMWEWTYSRYSRADSNVCANEQICKIIHGKVSTLHPMRIGFFVCHRNAE